MSNALQKILSDAAPREKALPAFGTRQGGYSGAGFGGFGALSSMGMNTLRGYTSWSYACINRIAAAVATTRYVVYNDARNTKQSERQEVGVDHWLVKLLNDPCEGLSLYELKNYSSKWFGLNGNSYLYAHRPNGAKYPESFWPLASNRVQVVLGDKEGDSPIKGYLYHAANGEKWGIAAEDMIHPKNPEPTEGTPFIGASQMLAAMAAVNVDIATSEFMWRYLQNDALPAFAVIHPETMDDDAFETFKARFNETFQGVNNAGKWALLEDNMQIAPISSNGRLQEMQAMDLSNRDRICIVFGVPEPYLTGKHQNKATAETVREEFYMNAVAPVNRAFCDALTSYARRIEPGTVVDFERYRYEDPAEVRAERESWNKMGVDVNRLLLEAGKEPLPDEEKPNELRTTVGGAAGVLDMQTAYGQGLIPRDAAIANAVLVFGFDEAEAYRLFPPIKTPAPAPAAASAPTASLEASKSPVVTSKGFVALPVHEIDEDALRALWKRYDDLSESGADRIKAPLVKVTERLADHVLGKFDKAYPGGITKDGIEASELFDVKEWKRLYAQATDPAVRRHLLRIAAEAMADVGATFADNEGAFNRRLGEAMTESTAKITTTVDTAHAELTALLKEHKGRPVAETRDAIMKRFEHYSKAGAENVARTTSAFTTGRAQTDAWKTLEEEDDEIIKIERVWLTRRGGKVRPSHAALDGTVASEEGFTVDGVTLAHPGAGEKADLACGCRCVLRGRVKRKG